MTPPEQDSHAPTLNYHQPDPPFVTSGARIMAAIAALVLVASTFGLWRQGNYQLDRPFIPAALVAFAATVFCLFVALGLIKSRGDKKR